MAINPARPYESPALQKATGPTIRPGGFVLTGRAVEFCGLPRGAAVLDMGCGRGATVHWLRSVHGLRAVGLDASLPLLSQGRAAGAAGALVAGRAERLPFGGHSFSSVFCECVLSIMDDPGQVLAELSRVLEPAGWLVISDLYARRAQEASALRELDINSCLRGARPRKEMAALVEAAGFEPALWEDHSDLLKNLAAKLVFEYGSMQDFWDQFAPQCSGDQLERGLALARPGYCLLVARKRGTAHG